VRLAPRADERAEYIAFHAERSNHERAETALREPLRKGELDVADIRLVDELPAHAARQAVGIDRNARLLRLIERRRELPARCADRRDGERVARRLMQTDASEVDRQILLDVAQHDPKDAR